MGWLIRITLVVVGFLYIGYKLLELVAKAKGYH